jgi:hypothetical protein
VARSLARSNLALNANKGLSQSLGGASSLVKRLQYLAIWDGKQVGFRRRTGTFVARVERQVAPA